MRVKVSIPKSQKTIMTLRSIKYVCEIVEKKYVVGLQTYDEQYNCIQFEIPIEQSRLIPDEDSLWSYFDGSVLIPQSLLPYLVFIDIKVPAFRVMKNAS